MSNYGFPVMKVDLSTKIFYYLQSIVGLWDPVDLGVYGEKQGILLEISLAMFQKYK